MARRPFGFLHALLIPSLVAAVGIFAARGQTVTTFDSAFHSRYLRRGVPVTDAPVLHAELDVASNGLSCNVWGNIDLTDGNDRLLEITEMVISLEYAFPIDPLNILMGFAQYMFPGQAGTREAYLHVAMLVPLTPSVGVYYDFDRTKGIYAAGDIHHVFALSDSIGLELRAAMGYGDAAANQDDFDYSLDALRDVNIGAAFQYKLDPDAMLSVGGSYWRLVDQDMRDYVAARDIAVSGMFWSAAFSRRF